MVIIYSQFYFYCCCCCFVYDELNDSISHFSSLLSLSLSLLLSL